MKHLLVFSTPMSAARAARIEKAVRAVDPQAWIMRGWVTPGYQPAVLNTDDTWISEITAAQSCRIAEATA